MSELSINVNLDVIYNNPVLAELHEALRKLVLEHGIVNVDACIVIADSVYEFEFKLRSEDAS